MKKLALHWQIIIGLLLGIIFGLLSSYLGWSKFIIDWIKPFGTIFINLLKLIAVPLVIASLITGISNLKDISQISRMGTKTILLYVLTTLIAITIGLLLVNLIEPGKSFSEEKRNQFQQLYDSKAMEKINIADQLKQRSPLQPLVDIVPENIFSSMTDNTRMLQVIFFSIIFGIAMVVLPPAKTKPVKEFIHSVNDIILRMVEVIMITAPIGVFALLAAMIADFAGDNLNGVLDLFKALGLYSFTVISGLTVMIVIIYPLFLHIFTKISFKKFYRGILPAQTLAFSTSSSAAALSVNMECVEKQLGVREEVASFVLPLGATVNMDGTSLYQAIAAVFIAQVFGMDLTITQQLTIVFTALLASIGAAPVPGAGMVMLVIILQSVGINPEGLVLIFAVDRVLDMCRTVVNVTSDACVAVIVNEKND